jgi:hypothetical protein
MSRLLCLQFNTSLVSSPSSNGAVLPSSYSIARGHWHSAVMCLFAKHQYTQTFITAIHRNKPRKLFFFSLFFATLALVHLFELENFSSMVQHSFLISECEAPYISDAVKIRLLDGIRRVEDAPRLNWSKLGVLCKTSRDCNLLTVL